MRELVIIRAGENPDLEKLWMEKAEKQMARFHPNRLKEWVNGRVALTLAFRKMNLDISPADEMIGYQKLKAHEDFTFSLSHTPGWAGALLISGDFQPGLDLENKDREIDENVLERFSHPGDEKLSPIILWSAKEAAYKTLPKEIQEKIWLQSIQVSQGKFSGEGFSGTWEELPHGELTVITAFRSL
jgi:4'-phosphopantetheinyl transferase EntD